MASAEDRCVVVENLSLQATETDLRDFFSFCGNIENIHMEASSDGKTQVARVTFDDVECVGTAVLLSDAIIAESPISIRPVNEAVVDTSAAGVAPRGFSPEGASPATEESSEKQRESATEIVLKMIAVGYIKGDALIRELKLRALKFDEKHGLTQKAKTALKAATETAQQHAGQLDDQFKLKQKAAFATFAFTKALGAGKALGTSAVSQGAQALKAKIKKGGKSDNQRDQSSPSPTAEASAAATAVEDQYEEEPVLVDKPKDLRPEEDKEDKQNAQQQATNVDVKENQK